MWAREEALTLEERRARYSKKFVTLDDIPTWSQYFQTNLKNVPPGVAPLYPPDEDLNNRVSIYWGNIVTLELDAIQNAANESLMGGGGIDGAIHAAAGYSLLLECELLNGALAGETKITRGYNLPAKYVLHTVGPRGEKPEILKSCYQSTLDLCAKYNIRSVAFCCVSTGIFGYPLERATLIALETAREWLSQGDNRYKMDRVVFCMFLEKETRVYETWLPVYFPPVEKKEVELCWPWGGWNVDVAGSFNGWQPVRVPWNSETHKHSFQVQLPPGTHQFKFIVDGVWKYDGQQPTTTDPMGNVNNYLTV
eukprot:TRINITY_DN446_c0_g1_i4.p1 TRINITY_DN446_c0_g1~~TRINITY_DN446_c0_g1_i4.p1  ORF type:complete len:350 (-),score=55.68 TRINITY_DN446_c0_g1_i4:149-1075(-)